MLTQTELKRLLHYDPETGIFTRLIAKCNKVKVGEMVGNRNPKGYLRVNIMNKTHLLHRLAWLYVYGYSPKEIDHINGVKDDNKIENLREAERYENMWNRDKPSTNTSGYKGVDWDRQKMKWRARCRLDGKRKHLGFFDTKDMAAEAYKMFAKNNHGEFYRD
jgi:hypothetical protein